MKTRPESLMDYVKRNDGRLPEELSNAMRQSCREAFFRHKEKIERYGESQ